MKKNGKLCRLAFAFLLAVFMLCGAGREVLADADSASLDLNAMGSIEIDLNSEDLKTIEIKGTLVLYKVADLSRDADGNMGYTYTKDFSGCPWPLDDVGKALLAAGISGWIDESDANEEKGAAPEPIAIRQIEDGTTVFSDLEVGLYLVVQTESASGYYSVKPFLVSVPLAQTDASGDSKWIYDVQTKPKMEFEEPQSEPESESENETRPVTEKESEPESEPETESETQVSLPQTGQPYWPILFLTVGGLFLVLLGRIVGSDRIRKKNDDA